MFGKTGNFSFFVTNGVNGSIYLPISGSLTNVMAGITNYNAVTYCPTEKARHLHATIARLATNFYAMLV